MVHVHQMHQLVDHHVARNFGGAITSRQLIEIVPRADALPQRERWPRTANPVGATPIRGAQRSISCMKCFRATRGTSARPARPAVRPRDHQRSSRRRALRTGLLEDQPRIEQGIWSPMTSGGARSARARAIAPSAIPMPGDKHRDFGDRSARRRRHDHLSRSTRRMIGAPARCAGSDSSRTRCPGQFMHAPNMACAPADRPGCVRNCRGPNRPPYSEAAWVASREPHGEDSLPSHVTIVSGRRDSSPDQFLDRHVHVSTSRPRRRGPAQALRQIEGPGRAIAYRSSRNQASGEQAV